MTKPADVVKELASRFAKGDMAGAMELYAPEFGIEQPASLPHGGWNRNAEGMAAMGAKFAEYWDRTITNPRIFGDDNTAVQITTQTWTAKATGKSETVEVVELFEVENGRITAIRVFQQDTHRLMLTLE